MSPLRIVGGLTAAWLLVACAAAPSPQQTSGSPVEPAQAGGARPAVQESLPNAELTPERLYQLLLGEIALQRGQYHVAAEAYLRAAHATGDPRLARRATRIAIYSHDGNRALEAARLWVEAAPDDLEAHQSFAALLIRDDRLGAAEPHLKRIIQLAGEQAGLEMAVTLLSSAADKRQALETFGQLTGGRSSPEVDYAAARLAFEAGEPALALERVDALLAQEPEMARAQVLRAQALRELGREREAADAYRDAVAAAPDDFKLRLTLARLLVDVGDLPAAREQFQALQERMPDNPELTYALGLLALETGDLEAAENNLRRLVEGGEYVNEAAYALGRIAEERGEPEQAMRWYGAVSQGENYLDAKIGIATILARRQSVTEARRYLAGLNPGDRDERIRLYLAEGDILYRHNRYEDSKMVYDRALEQYPDSPELRYARAMVAEKLDRLDLLEQDLRTLLKADPDNAQALNALGYTLADRTDRHREAHGYIQRALELSPEDPAILDSMGWVLYRMGRNEEALDYLRRALAQESDPEIAAHLGEVLWQNGHRGEARQVWEAASRKEPDNETLKKTRERFLGP